MDRHALLKLVLEEIDRNVPLPTTPEGLAGTGSMRALRLDAAACEKIMRELEGRGYLRNLSNPAKPVYKGISPAALDQLNQTAPALDPALWGDIARG